MVLLWHGKTVQITYKGPKAAKATKVSKATKATKVTKGGKVIKAENSYVSTVFKIAMEQFSVQYTQKI